MAIYKRIHHHVKYGEIDADWYDFFTSEKISPEIYFSGVDLDSFNQDKLLSLEKDLHQRNLVPSLHAPFMDLSPGSLDPKIREVTKARLNHIMDLAEVLRPTIINCHAYYDRHRFGGKMDAWLENAIRTFEPLVRRVERSKSILTVENTFEDEPTPIDQLIEKIGSPYLRACFDNGHFHIFHKVPLKKWWKILGDKTIHLHIHDNHGERDEHLPLGGGNFPFPVFFNLLKDCHHEMSCTLECRNLVDARKALKSLRRFIDPRV